MAASATPTTPLFPASLLSSLSSLAHPPPASASAILTPPQPSFSLPEGYSIRPLQIADYRAGLLDVLRVLTTVGDFAEAAFAARFGYMRAVNWVGDTGNFPGEAPGTTGGSGGDAAAQQEKEGKGGTYFVLVVCDGEGRVVGTGAVVVERKFIHNLGLVGHIEDIAVAKDQQGKKLGLRIIQALDHVAHQVGCYKTILDCSEANEGFYVKCGYKRVGLEMAHYYEAGK